MPGVHAVIYNMSQLSDVELRSVWCCVMTSLKLYTHVAVYELAGLSIMGACGVVAEVTAANIIGCAK